MLKVQKKFCIVKIQRISFSGANLLRMLTKKEPLLKGKIRTLKKFRRKDTSYTKLVVNKLQRNMLCDTVKAIGFKVLRDKEKRLGLLNKIKKEVNGRIKLFSLNINHLSSKREEELEVLLKKEKPEIMCLQETWRTSIFPLRLEKYTAIETIASGKNRPGLITLDKNNGAIRCSKKKDRLKHTANCG